MRWPWKKCKCDCHSVPLDLPNLGLRIVTEHSHSRYSCCRRGLVASDASGPSRALEEDR